jgi:uncharacterized 2Fe-2S/4Fe-4S cluster protein (DUF4445 family)
LARLGDLEGVTLFADIGANGEMVLVRNGILQVTSTAAGGKVRCALVLENRAFRLRLM